MLIHCCQRCIPGQVQVKWARKVVAAWWDCHLLRDASRASLCTPLIIGRSSPSSLAHESMGNGMCSRRQKRIFQALAFLAVAIAFVYGALVNYELQKQLKKAEALALKYQQHQESLSAQLQGMYRMSRMHRLALQVLWNYNSHPSCTSLTMKSNI